MLKALKWFVRFSCLLPFAVLLSAALHSKLGPDPADTLAIETGRWALRFLLLSLAITPLRNIFALSWIMPFRRTFGLFAFFYASLHLVVYLLFLLRLRWSEISEDILERPYIMIGFAAYMILLVLATTSTKATMRWLGKRWKQLHQLVYVAILFGLIHLVWILRADLTDAVVYASIVFVLLTYRVYKLSTISKRKSRV